MRNLIVIASLALTVIMFGIGYAVDFLVTVIAMSLELPGPYADSPIAWVWFAVSLVCVFGVSILFCRWLARRIERKLLLRNTFV